MILPERAPGPAEHRSSAGPAGPGGDGASATAGRADGERGDGTPVAGEGLPHALPASWPRLRGRGFLPVGS